MAKVVGYEVQKKLTSAWEPLETFGVDELREAQAAFAGYERRPPAPSIRLIEETLMDDGLFKSKTLIRKKLDNYRPPQTPNAVRPTAVARPLNKGGDGTGRSAGDKSGKKQKKSGSLFGSLISMLFGADGAPQEQKIEGVAADIVAAADRIGFHVLDTVVGKELLLQGGMEFSPGAFEFRNIHPREIQR